MAEHIIVMTTTNTKENAEEIVGSLLEKRLAACIQKIPVSSSYLWKGEVQSDEETLLLIKSRGDLFPELEREIANAHKYEEPEIIAVPIDQGSSGYLGWINESTSRVEK